MRGVVEHEGIPPGELGVILSRGVFQRALRGSECFFVFLLTAGKLRIDRGFPAKHDLLFTAPASDICTHFHLND
jgi:hypothetical protein